MISPSRLASSVVAFGLVFGTGIGIGLFLHSALAWTDPTQAPPNANVSAPINASATVQTKIGGANFATTSGSVGVGTAAPASPLHVAGANGLLLETAAASARGVSLRVLTNSGATACSTTCGANACLLAFRDDTNAGITCADATSVNKNCLCGVGY